MKQNEVRANYEYWFGGKTLQESLNDNQVAEKKEAITERKSVSDMKQKFTGPGPSKPICSKCRQKKSKCVCDNAKKADKTAKSKKGKNKMDAMPVAASKPMAAKNSKKADKKKLKEAVAKVVYGIKEGQEVKRYAIEKADMSSALASAKRMAKTKDLSTVSFIEAVDLQEGIVKTVYETMDHYKTKKRIFETHVLCSECGSGDLQLSKQRTKIRCKRCGEEDLVENVDGVTKK